MIRIIETMVIRQKVTKVIGTTWTEADQLAGRSFYKYKHKQVRQCGRGRGLPARQVSSRSIQPFGHSTPTSKTGYDRTGQTTVR